MQHGGLRHELRGDDPTSGSGGTAGAPGGSVPVGGGHDPVATVGLGLVETVVGGLDELVGLLCVQGIGGHAHRLPQKSSKPTEYLPILGKMFFNTSKCKVMVLNGCKTNIILQLNNENLEFVDRYKYLGITFVATCY